MAASATDIITYIGVPLAVLGVLPIIYTAFRSYLTLRSIQRSLVANGVSAMTRGSLLSGDIEVEIPRKRILPPNRNLDSVTYLKISERPSALKGGSWSLLHWQTMIIGTKTYRLRYSDELRQPQAEIDLEPLIAYLLDLGAVPAKQGFTLMKSAGIWTPAGTVLMVWPETGELVLHVSTPDDSDGVLSLALNWRHDWDHNKLTFLPPYCIRLQGDRPVKSEAPEENVEAEATDDVPRYKAIEPALHLRIDSSGIVEAHDDDTKATPHDVSHLQVSLRDHTAAAQWFASAATALNSQRNATSLWAYAIPHAILEDCSRNTIPAGVMVLLGFLADDEAPRWRSRADAIDEIEMQRNMIKMREHSQAIMEELKMNPADRQQAVMARQRRQANEFFDEARRKDLERQQAEHQDALDALRSEKLLPFRVGQAGLAWLVREGMVRDKATIAEVVEGALHGMVTKGEMAVEITGLLSQWSGWGRAGGMAKTDMDHVKSHCMEFAYAACIVALIAEMATKSSDSLASDLQQCLQLWKRVRLG